MIGGYVAEKSSHAGENIIYAAGYSRDLNISMPVPEPFSPTSLNLKNVCPAGCPSLRTLPMVTRMVLPYGIWTTGSRTLYGTLDGGLIWDNSQWSVP